MGRLAAVLVLLGCVLSLTAGYVVKIEGRKMFINGKRFIMKGVSYQPTEIGMAPDWKFDYFTDEDKDVWMKDIDTLRSMGVNFVRIFGWDEKNDHSGFMDYCYNNGKDPIYLTVSYYVPTYYDLYYDVHYDEIL